MNKDKFNYYRLTKIERFLFESVDLNESMIGLKSRLTKELVLINSKNKKAYQLINNDNYLMMSENCFDYSKIEQKCYEEKIEKSFNIHSKRVNYDFYCVIGFRNGKSLWRWDFYPDGVYLADVDGFGVKPNNEIKLYGIISDEGNVLIPFQPFDMNESEIFTLLTGEKDE